MSRPATSPNAIGRYELVTKLAVGGMAELYLARERGLGGLERLVVIKRILPELADRGSFVDMFLREARIVARLNHPNVVQIYELGADDGDYFIAMEYIHGSTVRELQVLAERAQGVAGGHPFPVGIAATIVDQACRGLHAAHELRDLEGNRIELIHRDVTPHNLMCTDDGYVKLLDFGVAKATEGIEATHSGNLKGKFAYMSPEQCIGEKLDRRTDIFALGVVLWELLTGERCFKRQGDLDTMRAITRDDPGPPSAKNPQVPAAIDAVVARALAKDRDERFETAEQMRQALLEAARDSGLHFGEDRLAAFCREVAGDQLDERRVTMHEALERSLTSNEADNLVHVTGSDSLSDIEKQVDELRQTAPTVVERPEPGTGSQSVSQVRAPGDPDLRSTNQLPTAKSRGSTPALAEPSDVSGSWVTSVGEQTDTSHNGKLTWLLALMALLVSAGGIFVLMGMPGLKSEAAESDDAAGPVLIGEPVRIGWAPITTADVLLDESEPIRVYLERKLGQPVEMSVSDSYEDLSEKLQTSQIDFGFVPPLLFVRTTEAEPQVDLLAIREFDGAPSSDALLLVSMKSDIRSLDDLAGKTFCFTDKNSTTGHFLPRSYVRRQGHDPHTFIGEIHWSGNHLQVLRDLLDGKCDAAATYSGSFLTAAKFGVPTGSLRTLAITGHVPQDAVVSAPKTAESLEKKVRDAVLTYDPKADSGIDYVGETLRITGFISGSNAEFKQLRMAVKDNAALLQKEEKGRQEEKEKEKEKEKATSEED